MPILILIAIFVLMYIVMLTAIVLTSFINAFFKNENIDESFLDRFERLNKEYFYAMFKKGNHPKYY